MNQDFVNMPDISRRKTKLISGIGLQIQIYMALAVFY